MKEQDKKARVEGDGASQLVQLIRKFGYNKDVDFELGTVTAAPPLLKVKLDGVNSFELDHEDLIVAEYLTNHKRRVNVVDTGSTDITDETATVGTSTTNVYITNGDINIRDGEIEFLSELKVGERVILANYNDGQRYIVIDRVVQYNGA